MGDTWEPFLKQVQIELDAMDTKIEHLCTQTGRPRRRVRSPDHARTATARGRNLRSTLPRRRTEEDAYDEMKYWERKTNYLMFPRRGNASARIYKPHRLEMPIYRTERKVIPVIRGTHLAVSDKTEN